MKYQIPKGLFDILPYEDDEWKLSNRWQYLESIIRKISIDYNFSEIRTPIFEKTDLFIRGVGASSDIATKEMYTFLDKADRSMSLRPEGTASVMRAFIEKNLSSYKKIHKLYYIGPMFRYDRPQKGRYRQHHQFGVEAIGNSSFEQDVEVIDLLMELYKRLGLQNLNLMINSVGDQESRSNYKNALKQYLNDHLNDLSKDSQVRFEKNILRVLDSKDSKDIEIVQKAPSILDFLSDSSKKHFESTLNLLDILNIPYVINDKLVRGLDYYDETVFEVISTQLGAQNSLGGGGRYNKLLSSLGGADLPGVGFAVGLERILQTMNEQNIRFKDPVPPFIYFIGLNPTAKGILFEICTHLRHLSIPVDIDLNAKKIQKSLQEANKLGASNVVIIAEDELGKNSCQFKDLETREQEEISLDNLVNYIKNKYQKTRQQ